MLLHLSHPSLLSTLPNYLSQFTTSHILLYKNSTDQRIKDKQYRGKDLGCIPTTYQDMMLNFAAPQFVILLKVDRILASG